MPFRRQLWRQLPIDFIDPGPAAKHCIFARNHAPGACRLIVKQRGRNVAAADILGQRPAYLFTEI